MDRPLLYRHFFSVEGDGVGLIAVGMITLTQVPGPAETGLIAATDPG